MNRIINIILLVAVVLTSSNLCYSHYQRSQIQTEPATIKIIAEAGDTFNGRISKYYDYEIHGAWDGWQTEQKAHNKHIFVGGRVLQVGDEITIKTKVRSTAK